jgi:hypothetical protein
MHLKSRKAGKKHGASSEIRKALAEYNTQGDLVDS